MEENLSTKLRIITAEFHEWFYTYHQDMTLPSLSSVYRVIRSLGYKRKKVTWRNIKRNTGGKNFRE